KMEKKEEKIEIIDLYAEHVYANLVSFNVNPEEICLGMGIRDVKDLTRVNIHTYTHMTIPHFLRFADMVNKQVDLLIEKGVIARDPEQ
ncbi:MAG TPA: hypothetical protein VLQ89_07650, partial [Candidatus Binatia bacterium]|nr:hypothetical protein [Candidatus Binatia bacterium]